MGGFTGLVFVFLSIALVNNLVFTRFLGICPYLGVSKKTDMAFGMGLAVTFVLTLSATMTWIINNLVLEPVGLGFTKYIAFILVIATFVQLVELAMKKLSPSLHKGLGIFLPLITTNLPERDSRLPCSVQVLHRRRRSVPGPRGLPSRRVPRAARPSP